MADYRNVPRVMAGISEWRPIGKRAEGVGARYQVALGELPIPVRTKLVIVEWKRPGAIAWTTESGPVTNQGRWTFTAEEGGTEVELTVTYQPPAGGLGNILAGGLEGIIRGRIVTALDRMKEELER